MKSNHIVGAVAISVVTIVVCLAYSSKFWQKKDLSLKESISLILTAGKHAGREFLEKSDVGYVKAWAKATKEKKQTFEFKGKTYLVNGGKAVKI